MQKISHLFEADASTSEARRKSSTDNIKVISQLLKDIEASKSAGKKSLVIFDIDSTLLDTSYRTGGIFKEFARHPVHKEAYPKLCKHISSWESTVEVYDPIEFVNHHSGISIENSSDTGKYLYNFWRKRFFNEDWLVHDLPYKGAQEFVIKCLEAGSDIAYLTGREHKTLFEGTIRSLSTHGFPYLGGEKRTRLKLKSSSSIKDLIYKDEGIKDLKKGYDEVFYIENEVELVLMAFKQHPDIKTYLFDSVHSGRAELESEETIKIASWSFDT